MPRTNNRPPAYRLQKSRNLAMVTIGGKDHYLGQYGSAESHEKYARLIAGLHDRGRDLGAAWSGTSRLGRRRAKDPAAPAARGACTIGSPCRCTAGSRQDVAVVVMGEFGRTPRINNNAGRDHWNEAGCVLLAGGGLRMGQVIGTTDSRGERSRSQPIRYQNIFATLYQFWESIQGRPSPTWADPCPCSMTVRRLRSLSR